MTCDNTMGKCYMGQSMQYVKVIKYNTYMVHKIFVHATLNTPNYVQHFPNCIQRIYTHIAMNTSSYQIQCKVIYLFTKLDSIYPYKWHICITDNKRLHNVQGRPKVHLTMWFFNFLKHNEIEIGDTISTGG
jgi:hypothetical protein